MALAYEEGDLLVLFVQRGELAPPVRRSWSKTGYWPLTALAVLSEEEREQFPITRWVFTVDMIPAVLRILNARKVELGIYQKEECERRVGAILEETGRKMEEANKRLDNQPAGM